MKRILASETAKRTGQKVKLAGWVHSRRAHGKIIFIDLRDKSGLIQVVFTPGTKDIYQIAQTLRPEWVISLEGKVKPRPKGMRNPKIETGKVELEVEKLEVLNKAKTPPIPIFEGDEPATKKISEESRLKYRYLDLRRERMKNNLIFRDKAIKFIRDFMAEEDFIEVETPILTKATPEGARDFLVPSRLQPGKFYALPQAPQQLKQLLMVAGLERYFQIARCFRDEDLRADRQLEFTQLDVEMSFVTQDDILEVIEKAVTGLVEKLTDKKLTFKPFKRMTHQEAIKKYKTDSPDLRKNPKNPKEIAFVWVVDWPLFEWNKKEKRYDPMHHVFTAPKEKDLSLLEKKPLQVRSWQHDLVCNGVELGGGSVRIHKREIQEKIFKLVGLTKKEAQEKFGHLLEAFEYGAPPHGGIALGMDRLIRILRDEPDIREVVAFPKSGDGRDLMMESPSQVTPEQLRELHIKIRK